MAKTVSRPTIAEQGCGFMGGISQLRRTYFPRKASLPSTKINSVCKKPQAHDSEKARSGVTENGSKKATAVHPSRSSTSSSNGSKPVTPRQQSNRDGDATRMISGQLGNLTRNTIKRKPQDHRHCNGLMGNIVSDANANKSNPVPEAFKSMGNEAYKRGCFDEALALYDRAISLDPTNATYRSNRSAALMAQGCLIEAVAECQLAIRIDPSSHRAHHRLANLYLRLGEAEKALYHYGQLGSSLDSKDISKAQSLQKHLTRCNHARRSQEWSNLLEETQYAVSTGADSSPEVYAMQVEALMKLNKHQEAHAIFQNRPNIEIDVCTNFFGLAKTAYLLMVASRVHLTAGRFEDAVGAAEHAARLNPSSEEVSVVVNKARAVSSARMSGNLLFKKGKYSEACKAYNEGLEHDQYNPVLLCNRAACRAKLGQLEKAVEDCTAALRVQPCYSKARLRRADCNSKMKRWEASIQDYEMLKRESCGDKEILKALHVAQLRKQQGEEDMEEMKLGSSLEVIYSNEHFRNMVASAGMCVVLFCDEAKEKQVLRPMQQVCKRFPSVTFLKVEVEEHPYLAKSEGVSSIPAFKIYKNGSQVKELPGNNCELLESSVRVYSS